jgi:hypothetical protein
MTPVAGECVVCGLTLIYADEAVRCRQCQRAGRWAPLRPDVDPDTARPDLPVLAVPRHRVGAVCRDGVWVVVP